jgi:hypothetical protein
MRYSSNLATSASTYSRSVRNRAMSEIVKTGRLVGRFRVRIMDSSELGLSSLRLSVSR